MGQPAVLQRALSLLATRPLLAAAGGVALAGAAAILLLPRCLPPFDLVQPWRPGKALAKVAQRAREKPNLKYVGYATCAGLPGHPLLAPLTPGSKSRRDFFQFSKEISEQLAGCPGFVGDFRCWRPLRNEFYWVTIWESKEALLHDFWTQGAHRQAMAFYKLYRVDGKAKAPFNYNFSATAHDIEFITHGYHNTVRYWQALRAAMPPTIKGALLASEPNMYCPSFMRPDGDFGGDGYSSN